jgi:hypothetical protein
MELYYPASLYCPRAVYEVAYASRMDLGDAIHACVQTAGNTPSICPWVRVDAALSGGLQRQATIRAGRSFKVRIQVTGAAHGAFQHTAVALALPEGVEYRKSAVRPRIKPTAGQGGNRRGKSSWVQQRSGVVYWPGTPSKASKTYTYTASLKVGEKGWVCFERIEGTALQTYIHTECCKHTHLILKQQTNR